MTNDNTRTKANAVFFSVLMVLSMVAVGFAAAPAAAVEADDTVEITDRVLDSGGNVEVTVDNNTTASIDGAVYITDINDEIVGSENVSSTGAVDINVTGTTPGTHTALLSDDKSFSDGDELTGDDTSVVDTDTAVVTTEADTPRTTDVNDNIIVGNGENVFQGEEDIVFRYFGNGTEVDASNLEGTSGNREGTPLQMPIPTDQDTGAYAEGGAGGGGFTTTVVEPRITTAELQLNDDDISEIATSRANNTTSNKFGVVADFNFEEAEGVSVEIQDPSGADITSEVLAEDTDDLIEESGGFVPLDMSTEDAGEYTVVFEGNNNLDYGGVIEEYSFTLTNDDTLTLDVAEDTVTQGDNVDFTLSGGINGEYHLVTIESDDRQTRWSRGGTRR